MCVTLCSTKTTSRFRKVQLITTNFGSFFRKRNQLFGLLTFIVRFVTFSHFSLLLPPDVQFHIFKLLLEYFYVRKRKDEDKISFCSQRD